MRAKNLINAHNVLVFSTIFYSKVMPQNQRWLHNNYYLFLKMNNNNKNPGRI